MKEILFRGKRPDNGQWVYGDLIHTRGGHPLICSRHDYRTAVEGVEVDYNTVCQYTGLKDKNGNKIFEGDIINIVTYENLAINAGFSHDEILQLSNSDCRGRFFAQWYSEVVYKECTFAVGDDMLCAFWDDPRITSPYFELYVCGNIHDNTELLKEGEK